MRDSVQTNRNRIESIFESAEQCYGDLFVVISDEDFSYLTGLYLDKPEEFKEWVPRIQWLSIDNDELLDKYLCCDNRQGEAYQEVFDDIDYAIRWFEGESAEDLLMESIEETLHFFKQREVNDELEEEGMEV